MTEFKTWNSYRQFANRVRRTSRFIRESDDEAFLREVLRTSKSRVVEIRDGLGLWRSQLGHGWRPLREGDHYVGDIPAAYPPERMKPLEGCATEGRANPKGIPVLYFSTRRQTAMSEVRPWLGSLVSCAHFKTTRPLQIVDVTTCSQGVALFLTEPDPAQREDAVWKELGRAFSEPTTSGDDTADYAPTQIIAELFKNEGYDGLAYKSAFGDDGYNIALFNLADARLTTCILHEVKSLEFSFEQADNPYWIEGDGTMKTISIDVIGPVDPSDGSQA